MKILFEYHHVERTEAHEEMVALHLNTVLKHAPQITKVVVCTALDHGKKKLRLEAHMPSHKNFSGDVTIGHETAIEHSVVTLVDSFSNWLEHKKSKMTDHGHVKGHAICQALEAEA